MTDETPLLNQQHLDMIFGLTTEEGRNLAAELLDHVTGEGLETLESLIAAVERHDFEAAGNLAHRLKGMSSNLGMSRLQERFRETEHRAKEGADPPLSAVEIQELRALVHESIEAYRAYTVSGDETA